MPKAGSKCDGGVDSVAGRDRGEGRALWRKREARLVFNLFNWKIGRTALPPLARSNSHFSRAIDNNSWRMIAQVSRNDAAAREGGGKGRDAVG